MEIYNDTKLPEDTEKVYYGFRLQLAKTYRWRCKIQITELYYDKCTFFTNKEHYHFCYKSSLCSEYAHNRDELILEYHRVFDNLEEAKENWNSTLQNYLDRYQSEFEKNSENIKKYKI